MTLAHMKLIQIQKYNISKYNSQKWILNKLWNVLDMKKKKFKL